MVRIEKVGASLTELPPAWISRALSGNVALGNYDRIKKMLGEPLPRPVDPETLPPEIKKYFARGGKLQRLAKKLKDITKREIKAIIPAKNTIASVDEDENLYVGVDFLEAHGEDDDLVASILAHEWGHLISQIHKQIDPEKLTWNQLFEIRRDEEAGADGFAGRALFLLGYKPEPTIDFLKELEKNKKLTTHKYHNTATRIEIIKQSYKAMEDALETAQKIFIEGGLKFGRILGDG